MYFKKNLNTQNVKLCYLKNPKEKNSLTTFEKPLSYLDTFHKTNHNFTNFLKQVPYKKDKNNKRFFPEPEDIIIEEIKKANEFQKQAYGASWRQSTKPFKSLSMQVQSCGTCLSIFL